MAVIGAGVGRRSRIVVRVGVGVLFALLALGNSQAQAQVPEGRSNYLGVRGELMSSYFSQPLVAPAGLGLEWGAFQNRFVATSTRLAFSRSDPSSGFALLLGGGPQFHFAIGEHVLIMPGLMLATRISEAGLGFAGYASLGGAFRYKRFYVGAEGEAPVFLQAMQGFEFFPRAFSVNLLTGIYF